MIPDKYKFLESIGVLPKMVDAALQYLGVREFAGRKFNNPIIMDMAKNLKIEKIYPNDEVAWCALFICHICKICGKPMPYKSYEIVRAASFAGIGNTNPSPWGEEIGISEMQLGDIIVFKRPNGHHVAILIAMTRNKSGGIASVHVIGGNQSNSVNISEMDSNRIISVRRYYSISAPESAKQYFIDSSGKLSVNES